MAHPARTAFLTLAIALLGGACSSAPPPGKQLTDGCYYARGVVVLKVEGDKATLLVPGNIQTATVASDASAEQSGVTFTPGFHLRDGSPLTVARATELPSSSMMMKPYTDLPTIMAIKDPQGLIDLVQGPTC